MSEIRIAIAIMAIISLSACAVPNGEMVKEEDAKSNSSKVMIPGSELGVETANFDTSVRPQDDFFRYVNGAWLESIEIPSDQSNYGSFTQLNDDSEMLQKEIIEKAAGMNRSARGDVARIGSYYRAFMNEDAVEAAGVKPLAPWFARIDAISSKDQLMHYFGEMQKFGLGGPIAFWVAQDVGNTLQYTSYLSQSGLSLPDRDYYLNEDDKFLTIREKYLSHIERMYGFANLDGGTIAAANILVLETQLAKIQWERVRNRDRNATYNPMDRNQLSALFGNANIDEFLRGAGIESQQNLTVRQPDYQEALAKLVLATPMDTWKDYLRWHLIDRSAAYLSADFVEADFDFFRRTLRGIEENRPRWKRAVGAVNGALGDAVGKVYVEQHFAPESKVRMDTMVENLRQSFARAIDGLEWMSDETKAQAHQKLEKFTPKIGYPEKWKDYSKLKVSDFNLLGNIMASAEVEYSRMLKKLGSPIDRTEWFMTPQTVNAYYSPSMNEIVFPAAILQPPFFNQQADDAVNYGAIGAVIGHEFSHGFDDQGRKSDGDGMLRDWWTDRDAAEFKRRADGLVEQFNAFEALPGEFVNGELTLGENIGDLAGLTMAYRAYKLSLNGVEPPVIGGYTGDQRFFLGWAQVWRRAYREDELRRRLLTDPHSPSEYRVNGIVAHMPEFHRAFGVKPGDKMYRDADDLIKIW